MKINLLEFENYTRFEKSEYHCPVCLSEVLIDRWPPNYFTSYFDYDGNYECYGTYKLICTSCKTEFSVHIKETNLSCEKTFSNPVPLTLRNGYWLTAHDLWKEDYKNEHGVYPMDAWG